MSRRIRLSFAFLSFALLGSTATLAQVASEPGRGLQPAALEGTATLTLPRALALAMSVSPELAVAQRELEASEGQVLQGGARPNPEVSLLLEDTQRATRTTTVQINQAIELGGQRTARINAAQSSRDIAAAELAAKRADVRAAVISNFYAVLQAQERIVLASDSVALAQRASEAAAKRVLAGKVSPVEETKARVAEASARLEAAQARSELTLARQRLSSTWGNGNPLFERADASGSAVTDLPALPSPQAVAARLSASPSLQRARIEVQRRRALVELERSKRTPDVTVSLGMKRDAQAGRNQAILGVSIPFPLFDRNQGNLLEALRREDKARDELVAAELQLQGAVLQSVGQLDAASTEARTLRDTVLPGAQSAYDAATTGFELGKFNFLDVLDAQRTLFQAKAQYLRALGQAQAAAAEIDRLLGDGSSAESISMNKPQE